MSPLNTQALTGVGDTPLTSTLSSLWYGDSATDAQKEQVAFVQSIPEFLKAPEGVTYSSIDIDDERMAPGRKKAEALEIEILFTEEQYDKLKALNDTTKTWFIQLPDATASTTGKPLTWHFTAKSFIGMSEIAIDDMLKSKITLYRSGAINESKGFPTASV